MLKLLKVLSAFVTNPSALVASWTETAVNKFNLPIFFEATFSRSKWLQSLAPLKVDDRVVTMSDAANGPCGDVSISAFSADSLGVLQNGTKGALESISENEHHQPDVNVKARRYSSQSPLQSSHGVAPLKRIGNMTRDKLNPPKSSLPTSSTTSASARSLPMTQRSPNRNLPPISATLNGAISSRRNPNLRHGSHVTSSERNPKAESDLATQKAEDKESKVSALSASLANISFGSKSAINGKQLKSRSLSVTQSRSYTSIPDLVRGLRSSSFQNIVIVQGAGVSTGSGIPDFRTKGTGLYSNLAQYNIPYPEAIFDIDFFRMRPKPFYTLAKELYPSGKYKPNVVHYFTRLLYEKEMLLRVYTQNIDGLERLAGIPPSLLVESHGTFSTSSCIRCGKEFPPEDMKKAIFSEVVAKCHSCKHGLVKPDITFFGEDLPKRFFIFSRDFPKADLVIVMGTSLEVEPFCSIIGASKPSVPRLLLNRDKVGPFKRSIRPTDLCMIGELEASVWDLIRQLGWTQELKDLISNHEPTLPKFDDKLYNAGISQQSFVKSSQSDSTIPNGNHVSDSNRQVPTNKNGEASTNSSGQNSSNRNIRQAVGPRPVPRNNVTAKPNSVARGSNLTKGNPNRTTSERSSTSESSSSATTSSSS